MMSCLDYLDYDVSQRLGEYHSQRKKYNKVIDELNVLIDFNVHMKYIQSFQFYKYLDHLLYGNNRWVQRHLLDVVKQIYNNKHKTKHLHDWPSKSPNFESYTDVKEFIHTRRDNYVPADKKFTGWRYRSYPPNKEYYPVTSLKLYNMS